MKRTIPNMIVATAVSAALAGCAAPAASNDSPIEIVVTTSILGDVVTNVVGDNARVETIMAPGVDPHDFAPSARQVEAIRNADLVVANGLGLEEGLTDVLESAAADGVPVFEMAPVADPLPFGADDHADDPDHGDLDPHFWEDPSRMTIAVQALAEALVELDPSIDWSDPADAYTTSLDEVDVELLGIFTVIPADRRVIVTNHDAFGYLADRYDLEVVAVVVAGGSTLAEPSASDLADLVAVVKEREVAAIFTDNTTSSSLAEAVAAEVGDSVSVHELYSGSLSDPDGPASNYLEMLRFNATTIADALG